MDYSVVEFGKGTLRYLILGPIIIVGYRAWPMNELYRDWPRLKIGRWNWIVAKHHDFMYSWEDIDDGQWSLMKCLKCSKINLSARRKLVAIQRNVQMRLYMARCALRVGLQALKNRVTRKSDSVNP